MEKLSREEMIRMAHETRKNVTNAPVSQEELDQYPVTMEHILIPTRTGDASAYLSYVENGTNLDILILNFHGGGFIRERTANDELFCRKLNHAIGCKIIDVDYKIAPDYPYPTAVHETYDVMKWAFANCEKLQIHAEKIILLGHSSGGNLAITDVMQANAENAGLHPLALIVEYPPLDIYTDPEEKPKRGKGVPAERARLYNLYYCDRELQKESYASPVYASEKELKHFPPTLIMTAGMDDLCTEAEDFALMLARAGNEVTLKRVLDTGHAFTIYRKEKHQEGFNLIVKFIRNLL